MCSNLIKYMKFLGVKSGFVLKGTASILCVTFTIQAFGHKHIVVSIHRLSEPSCHLGTGQNKHNGKILLSMTYVISIMVGYFDCKHSCLVEKNVAIAFILPVDGRMVLRV